jgi:heat shock protein HslJ
MKRASFFVALIVVASLFQSCSNTKNMNMVTLLGGKSFTVETIMGTPTLAGDFMKGLPFFTFGTDGKLSGSTGCNSFNGSYKEDGNQLYLDPGALTRMACPGTSESYFLNAMKQVNGMKATTKKIKLMNGANEVMSLIPKL